jgi:chromosome segregation protein
VRIIILRDNMVRLDRITMQGFKSFAPKTTIPFPTGFNIIAGPNGSGKSNVIDALMFVLGTSSARSIRAQKLQNLLFNGAKDRKPADFCEVSLYLNNADKKIPDYEEEVKVMRRVNRSGVSIYKINGKTVTRSKVLDVLANANLSPEGFNIIMQGDVAHIIEMSNLERRAIIDDIAGIREFDEKKEKATHELEKVENMVRENMIVMAEKQRIVVRYKDEKENAEKYRKLDEQLKKTRASLAHKKLVDVEKKMIEIDKDVENHAKEFDENDKKFLEIEKILEKEEKIIKLLGDEIIKKSRDYQIMRKIDSLKTDILRKKDKIDLNEREIQRMRSFIGERAVPIKTIVDLKKDGVHGTVSNIVTIPKKYSIAMEVAIGRHINDIVVGTTQTAIDCINYLKEKKVGRARFLPLDKIKGRLKKPKEKTGIIGHALDLIKYESKYKDVFEYILGDTLVVSKIEDAKKIDGFRVVTLDGDLKEKSGAIIGGFYAKASDLRDRAKGFDVATTKKLEEENKTIETEVKKLEAELTDLKGKEEEESEEVKNMQEERDTKEGEIEKMRKERREIFEKRTLLQNALGKRRVEKAHLEATRDNLKLEFNEYKEIKEYFDLPVEKLQENISRLVGEINKIGPVNMKAIEEFDTIKVEFEELKKKLDKLLEEKEAVTKILNDVEKRRYAKFSDTLSQISKNFSKVFNDMTSGTGNLRLEEENNIESGLVIEASLPGKGMLNLDSISGGEKTLTSLSFLFAVMEQRASPFYVLDEVDAALDKVNTKKITNMIKKYSAENKQFIVITHNDITIAEADKVFGVSMEDGVSKVFGIELPKREGRG